MIIWVKNKMKKFRQKVLQYYEQENGVHKSNVKSNIVDMVALLVYTAISLYNSTEKIVSLKELPVLYAEQGKELSLCVILKSDVTLLVILNFLILLRNHISLQKRTEDYKKSYIIKQGNRTIHNVVFPAWMVSLYIVWLSYAVIVVVLICVAITGNDIIHPIGLIGISTTIATLVLGLIADTENLFGLQPVAYERR